MHQTVSRTEHQRAITLLRWLRLEAMGDGDWMTWRETQSGFRILRNGAFECYVSYEEIRGLAQERLCQPSDRPGVEIDMARSSGCGCG